MYGLVVFALIQNGHFRDALGSARGRFYLECGRKFPGGAYWGPVGVTTGSGGDGWAASIIFPVGASDTMFVLGENAINAPYELYAFRKRMGRLVEDWHASLSHQLPPAPSGGSGTLAFFLSKGGLRPATSIPARVTADMNRHAEYAWFGYTVHGELLSGVIDARGGLQGPEVHNFPFADDGARFSPAGYPTTAKERRLIHNGSYHKRVYDGMPTTFSRP